MQGQNINMVAMMTAAEFAIEQYWVAHGFGPSYRDLQSALGIKSLSTVHRIVKRMEEENLVVPAGNRKRGIVLVRTSRRW